MVGTTLSQAIPIAASFILARLYTPEEFGTLFIIVSAITIFGIICTGRYELAILLPKEDDEAINLTALSVLLAFITSCVLLAIVYFFNAPITELLNEPTISPWLYAIPVSVFFVGIYQAFTYYTNRKKYYKNLITARISDSVSNSGSRIGAGYADFGVGGLIGGNIIGQIMGFGLLGFFLLRKEGPIYKQISWAKIKEQAKKYSNHPRHLIAGQLINNISYQSPNLLLPTISFFTTALIGQLGFANRLVRTPIMAVSNAFSDVFKQQASEEFANSGSCKRIFFATLKKLLLISVVPFLIFFAVAPFLFTLLLGEQWEIAGQFARIMTIPFFLGFTISPLSSVFYIVNKTQAYLVLQIILFALVVVSIFVAPAFIQDPYWIVGCLAASYSIFYVLMTVVMLSFKEIRK